MSDLPDGWADVPLIKLAGPDGMMCDGDWVETKDQDTAGNIRLTQLADVGDGVFRDRSSRFINEDAARRLNVAYLRAGDILIARMPDPLGRACIFPGLSQPAVTAVDVMITRIDGSVAEPAWVVNAINSPDVRSALANEAGGSTRQRVAGGKLKSFVLPTPPLPEQRRIAAKVEKLRSRTSRARAELDRIPALVNHYKSALLSAAFSGELTAKWRAANSLPELVQTTVGAQTTITSGFGFPKHLQGKTSGKYPFAKVGDISKAVAGNGGLLSQARHYVDDGDLAILRARCVPTGSTVFAKIGEALKLNRRALTACELVLDNNCMALSPLPGLIPSYLFRFMETVDLSPFSVATSVPSVRRGDVSAIEFLLPHPDEQAEVIRRINVAFAWLDHVAADHNASIRLLQRLDAAILAKAFHGELVLQDPADEPVAKTLARVAAAHTATPATKRGRRARAN